MSDVNPIRLVDEKESYASVVKRRKVHLLHWLTISLLSFTTTYCIHTQIVRPASVVSTSNKPAASVVSKPAVGSIAASATIELTNPPAANVPSTTVNVSSVASAPIIVSAHADIHSDSHTTVNVVCKIHAVHMWNESL